MIKGETFVYADWQVLKIDKVSAKACVMISRRNIFILNARYFRLFNLKEGLVLKLIVLWKQIGECWTYLISNF